MVLRKVFGDKLLLQIEYSLKDFGVNLLLIINAIAERGRGV